MRNLLVAVGAGLAATAVAASTAAGSTTLAVVLAVAQVLLACAWTSALGATAGTTLLVVAAAVASDVTLLVSDDAAVGDLVGVAGLAIVATILYQLARRRIRADAGSDPSPPQTAPLRVTSDMAASLGGVSVVVFFATLLALGEQSGSSDADAGYPLIVTGLLGAGAAVFVPRCLDAVVGDDRSRSRRTASWATVAGVAAAAGVGAAYGTVATSLTAAEGAVVAVVSGAAAAVADAALARSGTSRAPSATGVAALLPLAVAAPTVYLIGQLFLP